MIVVAAVRFLLSGVYELTSSTLVNRLAGGSGYLIAVLGVYGGLALVLEEAKRRSVLPLGRLGESATALNGRLRDQVAPVVSEAGVRRRL